jgi:uncharacterized membrane protein
MKLENVIHIDAPVEAVWAVTEDVERWPEWTPTMESVKRVDQGPFDVGSAALIKQPGLPEARWVVTALTRGKQFTWESQVRGMQIVATHEMAAVKISTQSLLRVELSGLVARLLWPFIRSSLQQSLAQENAGLKSRCEAVSS